MASCPRCKTQYPDGRQVCPNDGAPLIADAVFADRTDSIVLPGGREPTAPPLGPPPIAPTEDLEDPLADAAGAWPYGTGAGDGGKRAETVVARPSRLRESSPAPAPGTRNTRTGQRRRAPSGDKPEERIGRVLGSYRLLDVLGRGGMGCVYRSEHIKLGRKVALKLLRDDYARRRDAVSRFFQEARSVNRIRHRNIVDITDFVELEDGTTFIIMELLDGVSLGKLARSGQLTVPRTLALLIQICDALGAAHDMGIIHRDLKPDNVIVVSTSDGADLVKLLDFGVAKLLYREDEDFGLETAAGSVIGTPAYMSPEQAGGLTVDERADLYSLGAIMYEIFTGQPMFRARSFGEYVRKHLNEHPPPPRRTPGGEHLDERIEAVILRCIQKRPDDRYPTASDLRADLLALLGAIDTNLDLIPELDPGLVHLATTQTPTPRPHSRSSRPGYPAHLTQPAVDRTGPARPQALRDVGFETAMSLGDVPATRISRPAPAWLPWVAAGAALAVVGGGVALYLQTRTDAMPSRPALTGTARPAAGGPVAAPAPVVTSVPESTVDPGLATARRSFVVRFDAAPRAEVYPADGEVALCTTPCDITIAADDGGPTLRHFLVRRDGYRARQVRIDVTEPRREVQVRLRPLSAGQTTEPEPEPEPEVTVNSSPKSDPEPEPEVRVAPPPDKGQGGGPAGTGGRIDPEDTIDPFGGR